MNGAQNPEEEKNISIRISRSKCSRTCHILFDSTESENTNRVYRQRQTLGFASASIENCSTPTTVLQKHWQQFLLLFLTVNTIIDVQIMPLNKVCIDSARSALLPLLLMARAGQAFLWVRKN